MKSIYPGDVFQGALGYKALPSGERPGWDRDRGLLVTGIGMAAEATGIHVGEATALRNGDLVILSQVSFHKIGEPT